MNKEIKIAAKKFVNKYKPNLNVVDIHNLESMLYDFAISHMLYDFAISQKKEVLGSGLDIMPMVELYSQKAILDEYIYKKENRPDLYGVHVTRSKELGGTTFFAFRTLVDLIEMIKNGELVIKS